MPIRATGTAMGTVITVPIMAAIGVTTDVLLAGSIDGWTAGMKECCSTRALGGSDRLGFARLLSRITVRRFAR